MGAATFRRSHPLPLTEALAIVLYAEACVDEILGSWSPPVLLVESCIVPEPSQLR